MSHALHERHTRDLHDGKLFYKMDAFGNKMHLKLTRNTRMVKQGLELETRHENGDINHDTSQVRITFSWERDFRS